MVVHFLTNADTKTQRSQIPHKDLGTGGKQQNLRSLFSRGKHSVGSKASGNNQNSRL